MAQRIIAIGGEPASGKSTLMKRIIKQHMPLKTFAYGLVRGLYSKDNDTYFIGIYDNSVFCGTDKLSMAVQPDFIKLLNIKSKSTFVFEGDRLFSLNNLELIKKHYKTHIILLENDSSVLNLRHKERNDKQSEKFIKGRYTKIKNITEHFKDKNIYCLKNTQDTINLADTIIEFL